jgi:biofilm PGA synthesis N-glycosyltransferase PgaC
MRCIVIVPFLNEERYLGTLLDSIEAQTRRPDRLLLVDDGSTDASITIAEEFATQHPYASVLRRPPRPPAADRLVAAAELRAFQWAVDQIDEPYDVIGKLDGDLLLMPETLAMISRQLESDPTLGIAGAYLSVIDRDGTRKRERCTPEHVRGATKFYRRECFEQISPLPVFLGWDTIDEVRARMRGWRTATFEIPGGDPLHMRPTGTYNGALRGFRRAGLAAYAYGAHPFYVLLSAMSRMRDHPRVTGGLTYIVGWALAALQGKPRAEPELRAFVRRENLRRIRHLI